MTFRSLTALICVVVALAPQARAADWFALEVGTERRFDIPSTGGSETSRLTAMDNVRGREVYRIENEQIVPGEGTDLYWNYWSVDGEGQLLLHGFKRGTAGDGWGHAYEPPLIFAVSEIDAPWSTVFDVHDFFDDELITSETIHGKNYGLEQLSLAVGTFESMVTGFTHERADPLLRFGPTGQRYSVTGRRIPDSAGRLIEEASVHWWVQGIGEVQYAVGDSDNIRSTITFASVPIEEELSSASSLKASFLRED